MGTSVLPILKIMNFMKKETIDMKIRIMKDLRNGIYPVIVYTKNNVSKNDSVDAVYPFGWEEYNGKPLFGRFEELSKEEAIKSLVNEIVDYRKVLKHLSGGNDNNLYDACYEIKPWSEEE